MRAVLSGLSVLLLSSHPALTQSAMTTPAACEALQKLQLDGVALTITRTQWFAAGAPLPSGRAGAPPPTTRNLPAYCRVDGVIDRRTGVPAGTSYGIGFALALPEEWNGRFLMQGGGGLNGSVQNPLGTSAAGDRPALARGFAVVSTDTAYAELVSAIVVFLRRAVVVLKWRLAELLAAAVFVNVDLLISTPRTPCA